MLPLPFVKNQTYAVFGLARSGLATVRALKANGAQVLAWDDGAQSRERAIEAGVGLNDLYSADWSQVQALVLSPGVPLTHPSPHPIVKLARLWDVPIIGDIELFARARAYLPAHKVVAITGTNGKSTTTALIHHMLAAAGVAARLGGNIGLPILEQEPLGAGGVYVLELSSFQIDLTQSLACEVAVLTNITPDHLDRHGDMAGYAYAKERLFLMQQPDHTAVISVDDAWSAGITARMPARPILVRSQDVLPGQQDLWPALQGPHNAQNAACAYQVGRVLGLEPAQILASFAGYPGLPHRMERVRVHEDVLWINDSKATNPASAAPAIAAYKAVHWILGGKAKTADLEPCYPYLNHVLHAYTIGEATDLFYDLLSQQGVRVTKAGTLAAAVATAHANASSGAVVLLSPACASYDQYVDYEQRGEHFRTLVAALGEARP
jgi:UDP-N-acetylmuramoylalanine--D-glutamate ligase